MAFQVAHSPVLAPITSPIYTGGAVSGGTSLSAQVLALGPDYMLDLTQSGQMFQSGTSLSTAASVTDDPVGLMADYAATGGKSIEGFLAGQSELVSNGTFDSGVTGWSDATGTGTTLDAYLGRLRYVTSTSGSNGVISDIAVTAGRPYRITAEIEADGANVNFNVYDGAGYGSPLNTGTAIPSGSTQTVDLVLTPTTSTLRIYLNTNASGTRTTYADNVSVKQLPTLWTQATALQRPLLGAGNSLVFDGNDDNIGVDFLGGAGPSDCSLWVAFKGVDSFAVLASDGSRYVGQIQAGNGAANSSGAGSTASFVDVVAVSPDTRGALYTAAAIGSWVVVEIRNADLSPWARLGLSEYTGGWHVNGAFGPRLLICSTATSNANRTLIDQWMREPLT